MRFHAKATLVLCLISAGVLSAGAAHNHDILAAVVLPANNHRFQITLSRVLPLLEMAAQRVSREGLLPGLRFRFMTRDGSCDGQLAQISAVEAFYKEHVNVFFGPTCEYSCAPIARMIPFWNTPLLTTGAFTHDFTKNKTDSRIENSGEYKLLTRVSPMAFEGLTGGIIQILRRNGWGRVMLFYDKNGYETLSGIQTCYLMMQTLVTGLKKENIYYGSFDTEKNEYSLKHNLKVEIGAAYGSSFSSKDLIPSCKVKVLPSTHDTQDVPHSTKKGREKIQDVLSITTPNPETVECVYCREI